MEQNDKKEYYKEYYQKNKEKMREHSKNWNEKNAEHLKEYRKKYYKDYYMKKKEKERAVNRILALNMCLTEAYLEGNQDDIKTFRNILTTAISEVIDKEYNSGKNKS